MITEDTLKEEAAEIKAGAKKINSMSEDAIKEKLIADAAARKAKIMQVGISTGKVLGLMGTGALLAIGLAKYRGRNLARAAD